MCKAQMNLHTTVHLLSQDRVNRSFLRGTQQSTQSHDFPVHKALIEYTA